MDPDSTNNKIVPYDDPKSSEEVEKIKLQIVLASSQENNNSDNNKKKKRKVLDEESYVEQISNIIERDFFPDVQKMRLELEYQDAIEKNDFEKIAKISREKIQQKTNNKNVDLAGDTPLNFDTPLHQPWTNLTKNDDGSEKPTTETNPDEPVDPTSSSSKMSLNKFLNKFTSEDNDSFEQLQEETIRKHNERVAKFNDSRSNNEKLEQSLALPSIQEQNVIKLMDTTNNESKTLITWKHTIKNSVMFDPEGVPFTEEELKINKSRQVIAHENTRFKANPFDQARIAVENVLNPSKAGKIGVDGNELTAKSTPSINGFSFVPSTPCFKPENLPQSPLMTWGAIEATPINLKGDATPMLHSSASHFTIHQVSEKELIGQKLADRILTRKRNLDNHMNFANPNLIHGINKKSSLERLNSMSPAARLLATKKLGVHQHMDRSLQASYSPLMTAARTPTPRRIVTPSPFSSTLSSTSTRIVSTPKPTAAEDPTNNKRPKADEFF